MASKREQHREPMKPFFLQGHVVPNDSTQGCALVFYKYTRTDNELMI